MSELPVIDWPVVGRAAVGTIRRGPVLTDAERADLVATVTGLQPQALELAAQLSELPAAPPVPCRVVGRRGWVEANVAAIADVVAQLDPPAPRSQWGFATTLRARALAVQLGLGMGWVSGKIIGQFQPFGRPEMLFVGPNLVSAQRELHAPPGEFWLWVSVHEQTHRLQFAAAPWLADHLTGLLEPLLRSEAAGEAPPEELMQRVAGVMSLLEGHAETIMDTVSPELLPSVGELRAAMTRRRAKPGLDRLAATLLGLDVKLAQYRDGAAFCARVRAAVGLAGLNRVFECPDRLPTAAEIHAPEQWLRRLG